MGYACEDDELVYGERYKKVACCVDYTFGLHLRSGDQVGNLLRDSFHIKNWQTSARNDKDDFLFINLLLFPIIFFVLLLTRVLLFVF